MTEAEAEEWIGFGEVPNFTEVRAPKISGQSRWYTTYEQVVQRLSDSTFWKIWWNRGSTEYQEDTPPSIRIMQVEPYEEVVINYRKKQ